MLTRHAGPSMGTWIPSASRSIDTVFTTFCQTPAFHKRQRSPYTQWPTSSRRHYGPAHSFENHAKSVTEKVNMRKNILKAPGVWTNEYIITQWNVQWSLLTTHNEIKKVNEVNVPLSGHPHRASPSEKISRHARGVEDCPGVHQHRPLPFWGARNAGLAGQGSKYVQFVHLFGYLDLKFHSLSPFGGVLGVFMQKGTNCEILNLNNWRFGRLKKHVIHITKKSCTDGENPKFLYFFKVTSHFMVLTEHVHQSYSSNLFLDKLMILRNKRFLGWYCTEYLNLPKIQISINE